MTKTSRGLSITRRHLRALAGLVLALWAVGGTAAFLDACCLGLGEGGHAHEQSAPGDRSDAESPLHTTAPPSPPEVYCEPTADLAVQSPALPSTSNSTESADIPPIPGKFFASLVPAALASPTERPAGGSSAACPLYLKTLRLRI